MGLKGLLTNKDYPNQEENRSKTLTTLNSLLLKPRFLILFLKPLVCHRNNYSLWRIKTSSSKVFVNIGSYTYFFTVEFFVLFICIYLYVYAYICFASLQGWQKCQFLQNNCTINAINHRKKHDHLPMRKPPKNFGKCSIWNLPHLCLHWTLFFLIKIEKYMNSITQNLK